MLTVLVKVEGTHNLRPLPYDEDNPAELLTPSVFGRRIQSLPEVREEEDFGDDREAYTSRYKYLGKKLHHSVEELAEGIFIGLARAS